MNKAIIKLSIQRIIKQPVGIFILFLFALIIIFFFLLELTFYKGQVIEVKFFGVLLDEPFVINNIFTSTINIVLVIIVFLQVVLAARYFHEFNRDQILDIILTKLKNKTEFLYSVNFAPLLLFTAAFLILLLLINFTFLIKYEIAPVNISLTFLLITIFSLLYVLSSSYFLTQLLDGFSVMLILIIPILFGNFLFAAIETNDILRNILSIVFPINKLISFSTSIFDENEIEWGYYSTLVLFNIVLLLAGNSLFLNKWK